MNYIQYMQTPFGPIMQQDATRVQQTYPVQAIVHPLSQTEGYLAWAAKQSNPSVEEYEKFLQETQKNKSTISQGREMTEKEKLASQQKLELYGQLEKEAQDRQKAGEVVLEGLNYISPSYWANQAGLGLNGAQSFVFDIAADPTTYLSLGAIPVTKAVGKKAVKEGIEKSLKEAVEAGVKSNLDDAPSFILPRLGTKKKVSPTPNIDRSSLNKSQQILLQDLDDAGIDVSKLTIEDLEDISFDLVDALDGKPEGIIKSGNTYYLVNQDGIAGALQVTDAGDGAMMPTWVENFSKQGEYGISPVSGVSEKLYNRAIQDAPLVSGGALQDPTATIQVLKKYPDKQLRGNYGIHTDWVSGATKFDQPVYLLTTPTDVYTPSSTINWEEFRNGHRVLTWKKFGGMLNYLNYYK